MDVREGRAIVKRLSGMLIGPTTDVLATVRQVRDEADKILRDHGAAQAAPPPSPPAPERVETPTPDRMERGGRKRLSSD